MQQTIEIYEKGTGRLLETKTIEVPGEIPKKIIALPGWQLIVAADGSITAKELV